MENFIEILPTALLQIFYKIILNIEVIAKVLYR